MWKIRILYCVLFAKEETLLVELGVNPKKMRHFYALESLKFLW